MLTNFFIPSSKSPSQSQVEGWLLSPPQEFKGCDISPDASFVAYWTDTRISLYTSQSLSTREAQVLFPVAWRDLEGRNCIWKTVVVTSKYLVASTTGGSFNVSGRKTRIKLLTNSSSKCFIFELESGNSVDVTLDHWCRLTLPLPEIHILAISVDRKTLSCVLRGKEDVRHPGSLLTSSINGLISYAKRPCVHSSTWKPWQLTNTR